MDGGGLVTQSCMTLCDPMDRVACQAPLSMGFSRQEYWSRLPFPSLGDLPDPGIDLRLFHLLHWQASPLPPTPPGKPTLCVCGIAFYPEGGGQR